MTERFTFRKSEFVNDDYVVDDKEREFVFSAIPIASAINYCKALNTLAEENDQLKQYKQAVSDVLLSWSQKNLTAKQLQVVIAIMVELGVMND